MASKIDINYIAIRQCTVFAEFTKATTEGNVSFPRQKKGVLLTLSTRTK